MLDQAEFEMRYANSRYYTYQEISKFASASDVMTDRMGLPDIYLTFFNMDYLPNLTNSLKATQVRDSLGYKKSLNLANIVFSSLDGKFFEEVNGEALAGKIFIELEEYLPDFPSAQSMYFKNVFHHVTEIGKLHQGLRLNSNDKEKDNLYLIIALFRRIILRLFS
jgi:hypothetical protein